VTRSADAKPLEWRTNLVLFLATVVSVYVTGAAREGSFFSRASIINGLQFSGALLTILVAHELGHYIAARIHKVDASLPYFIPLPILSPFGTMGAVIRMKSTIPTRKALLDIGAAGPLAGLVFAIPMYAWGLKHSKIIERSLEKETIELGDSLLARALERVVGLQVPDGHTVMLSPIAFAAWAGFFVTMINLLPVGQLDGGHVAYSLFGPRQNKIAQWVHRSMLAFFFVSLFSSIALDVRAGFGLVRMGMHVGNALFWLVWFEVLGVLGALAQRGRPDAQREDSPLTVRTRLFAILGLAILASIGREKSSMILWLAWFVGLAVLLVMERRFGTLRPSTLLDHPPTGAEPLGTGRKIIAVITLLFFAALFMPTPIAF
jgi:membrane-associated protease RseP (regulator of RpoE activity)